VEQLPVVTVVSEKAIAELKQLECLGWGVLGLMGPCDGRGFHESDRDCNLHEPIRELPDAFVDGVFRFFEQLFLTSYQARANSILFWHGPLWHRKCYCGL
jgi:hypothetical protein